MMPPSARPAPIPEASRCLFFSCGAAFFCFALGMEVGASVSHAAWYAGQDWWRLIPAGVAAVGIAAIPWIVRYLLARI